MLEVVFSRVRENKLEALRSWMAELNGREDEVLETFRNEGTRHERAFLVEGFDGPVLVYVMEVEDSENARRAYADSALPIDWEHRRVMDEVLLGPVQVEELLNLRVQQGR